MDNAVRGIIEDIESAGSTIGNLSGPQVKELTEAMDNNFELLDSVRQLRWIFYRVYGPAALLVPDGGRWD